MNTSTTHSGTEGPVGLPALILMAALAAAASLLISGFEFGVHNNVYHVPYVLGWERLPQFADDAFYQSLRYFTSGVWVVLRAISTEDNVAAVFFVCHVLTRFGTLLAMALLVREAGVTGRAPMALAMGVFAVTAWLQQGSVVANHALFVDYFAHSDAAWPFVLFSVYFAQQRRWLPSAIHAAIAFVCNAFVGMWLAAILLVVVGLALARPGTRARPALRSLALAAVAYALIAAPVLAWIGSAVGGPVGRVDFSFREYLELYYPRHFFLEPDPATIGRLGLLLASLGAGLASTALVAHGRFWRITLLVSCVIFSVGAVAPLFFDSKLLFNLHLMRVEGFMQLFSQVLVVAGCVRLLCEPASLGWQRAAAGLSIGLLCMPWRFGMPAIAVLCLAAVLARPSGFALPALQRLNQALRRPGRRPQSVVLALLMVAAAALLGFNYLVKPSPASVIGVGLGLAGMAALWLARERLQAPLRIAPAAVLIGVAGIIAASVAVRENAAYMHAHSSKVDSLDEAGWLDLAAWIRTHPIDGVVLVPVEDHEHHADDYMLLHNFQLTARTPVWVDWKQGAAVMWSPQFFHQWAPRYLAAKDLKSPEDFMAFARRQGLRYFVPRPYEGDTCPKPAITVKASGRFKLCSLGPPGAPRTSAPGL